MKLTAPILLLAAAALAGPATAQTEERAEDAHAASAHVSLGVRGTRLRERSAVMVGGDVSFLVADRLLVGTAGWTLTRPLALRDLPRTLDLTLEVAYGGLFVERLIVRHGAAMLGARLMSGAGNAKVSLAAADAEIASDNFGVAEPEIVVGWRMSRVLAARAQASYRFVFGAEDLLRVTPAHLRGAGISLLLALGPF